jgi:hypothetical protein
MVVGHNKRGCRVWVACVTANAPRSSLGLVAALRDEREVRADGDRTA